jgi:hypothetical protein
MEDYGRFFIVFVNLKKKVWCFKQSGYARSRHATTSWQGLHARLNPQLISHQF